MKKEIVSISIFFLGFCSFNCNSFKERKDVKEEELILKIGQEIAFREYGDIIKSELPLRAKLVGDTLWVVEGTLQKGLKGGTVYIEIRKSDKKVLKIIHYK